MHAVHPMSPSPAPLEALTEPSLQEQEPKLVLVTSHLGVLAGRQLLSRGVWAVGVIAASFYPLGHRCHLTHSPESCPGAGSRISEDTKKGWSKGLIDR